MKRLCLALAIALAAPMGLATAAHAEVYTCGTHGNLHDGYGNGSNDSNSWEGTSATIVVRHGSVCDTDTSSNNTSSAWTMVNAFNTAGWAQSGYIRWYGSSIYHFAQYRRNSSTAWVTKIGSTALTAGSSYKYWQQSIYNSSAGQWQIRDNVNSTVLLQTNFNTFSYWNEPFSVQWSGETDYAQSDVPGSSSATAKFSNMQVQRYSDDGWQSGLRALGAFTDTSSRYHRSSVSSNSFSIWT